MAAPLAGMQVADFSRHMSGPYGTLILGDYGADVVKVESLPGGDPSRRTGTAFIAGESALFLQWNRSKRSLALDLRHPEGVAVARRLVEASDVVVENYRPGVADAIGIGYEAMVAANPRLVYCSVTGFGPDGPLADLPGTDPVIQAMSGVMSLTGETGRGPVLVGVPIADFTGAMALVQGVLFGLLARERTGRGQKVDVPMLAALVFSLTTRLASFLADGHDPVRNGAAHSVVAPYQLYRTSDGEVVAGAWAPEAWPRFCAAIDRPDLVDDPRFATNHDRVASRAALDAVLMPLFASRTTAAWAESFRAAEALFGEVCTVSRALDHEHARATGMVTSVDHPVAGPLRQIAPPIRLSETPGSVVLPPPQLGEHSSAVLRELGYDAGEIGDLLERGVVAVPDDARVAP